MIYKRAIREIFLIKRVIKKCILKTKRIVDKIITKDINKRERFFSKKKQAFITLYELNRVSKKVSF